ncbi:MAG: ATP-binding protein [Acidaminococcaceae bacterium]
MKNKIALKLTFYFAAALLIFALVVGGSFRFLFWQHTEGLKRDELEQRAVKIAQAMVDTREQVMSWQERMAQKHANEGENDCKKPEQGQGGHFGGWGYASMLRFLSSSAADDVWIVDHENNLEVSDHRGGSARIITYKDLPPDADKVIKEAFQGKTVFGQGFSQLLQVPTLTVATPIQDESGQIVGVVLLHSPLSGMEEAAEQGMKILLISVGIALFLTFIFSLLFTWKFTKPLNMMKRTADEMAEGNYAVRSGVQQNDEIGELGKALDILGERLEIASQESAKLDQLRKDFIANISHELRTPVTVIRGSLEAICDKVVDTPEKIEEYHRQMLSESIFLQRLINDLLDLSRLQNHNFQIEKTPLNLCDVVQDVVRSSQHIGKKKAVAVSVSTDVNIYSFNGDYGRLRQMLMIFLDNAIKFSPLGGKVEVLLADNVLKVIDHGCGISNKDLPHVFERFYKTRVETNKSGTGLGLAIAKEIAERHNIKVSMVSEPNVSTAVIMVLPLPAQNVGEK